MSEIKTKKNFVCRRVPNGDGIERAKYKYVKEAVGTIEHNTQKTTDESAKYKYVKETVGTIEHNTQKTTDESDYEQRRVNGLLHVIFKICELSGFWVEERIVLKDRKTGKIWR